MPACGSANIPDCLSAFSGMRLLACLIVAPQRGYDEPAILSYAISSFCPTSADGLHSRNFHKFGSGLWVRAGTVVACCRLLFQVAPVRNREELRATTESPKSCDLYGAIGVKAGVNSISLFDLTATISSSRPNFPWPLPRSGRQGWPKAIAKRLALDGREHSGRLVGLGRPIQ
jgi:hypothetical protein